MYIYEIFILYILIVDNCVFKLPLLHADFYTIKLHL